MILDKKSGVLAADDMGVYGNGIKGRVGKLWVKNGVAFAVAGNLEEGIPMRDAYFAALGGAEVAMPETEETVALILDFRFKKPRGTLLASGVETEIEEPVLCIGSGGGIATGAIAAGKTFLQALKIAHKYDPFTGRGAVWYDGKKLHKSR